MKKLLAMALVAAMAGVAFADAPELGMFFNMAEFSQANTNFNSVGAPFNGYIVVMPMGNVESVGGYEVGIGIPGTLFVLAASGPNGWTNFGSNVNHLAGYGTPLPVVEGGSVLCTMNMMYIGGAAPAVIEFYNATPASIPGHFGPVVADGANPDLLLAAWLVTGQPNGVVATINGAGVVAVENHTWTGVKNLFD